MRILKFCTSALVLLVATACNPPLPVTPTSSSATPPTTTTPAPQAFPQVEITLVGGNGPTDCSTGPRLGEITTFPLGVNESASSVQLILDPHNYPTDHYGDYEGSVTGTSVTASGHYYGNDLCGGGTIIGLTNYGVPATFTGTLSADATLLTGHEIRTSMLGQKAYTYEYDWRAALR
jgi:hypothetical protein